MYTDIPVQKCHYFSLPRKVAPGLTARSLSKSVIEQVRKFVPDVVHINWLYPCGLAAVNLKKEGYRVVITIHGSDWYLNIRKPAVRDLIRNNLSAADWIITVGEQLKVDVIKKFPFLKDKVTTVHNSVDSDFFKPGDDKTELQNAIGWDPSDIHILCVANLYHVKGIDLLIKAFSEVPYKSNVRLNIVSGAYDVKYRKEIMDLVSESEWSKNIAFHPSMRREQLLKFYQASDIFVLPSRSESFGLALAEAAACGLPSIATKSGGPQELVTPGTGMLTENGDPTSIAKCITWMLSNFQNYNSMEIRSFINQNFSRSHKMRMLNTIYEKVADE